MACVLKRKNKKTKKTSYMVSFFRGDERPTIYLGAVPKETADTVRLRIEHILAAKNAGTSVNAETASWISSIGDELAEKLANVGLIETRQPKAAQPVVVTTLGPFLTEHLETRTDIKPRTKDNFEQAKRWLVEYFGAEKPLAEISRGDADEWRLWLGRNGRQTKPLGKNTIRRHCGRARQFFEAAKKKRLIAENPFAGMKDTSVKENRERDFFVTREIADKVLAACPDCQWRLLFALSRFGGLRCPSEPVGLTWADVDFEASRMTVRSPKTEHHEGKESRVVPIFPELRPYLEAAKAEASKGATHVITLPGLRRDRYANVGTHMARIIRRAGVKPWPKLFHNMRATRETELAQQFPVHVVCDWIGHNQLVAKKHYLRTTDEDYAKAAGGNREKKSSLLRSRARRISSVICIRRHLPAHSGRMFRKP